MAFNPYDTLPVADEALDKGGVELLRAGLAEQQLYVTVRRAFEKPDRWGGVLADVTLHLAALYAQDGDLTKANVIALVAETYGRALRKVVGSAGRRRPAKAAARPAKTPGRKAKALARSKAKPTAGLKARSRTAAKRKPAGKAVAGRKGRR